MQDTGLELFRIIIVAGIASVIIVAIIKTLDKRK